MSQKKGGAHFGSTALKAEGSRRASAKSVDQSGEAVASGGSFALELGRGHVVREQAAAQVDTHPGHSRGRERRVVPENLRGVVQGYEGARALPVPEIDGRRLPGHDAVPLLALPRLLFHPAEEVAVGAVAHGMVDRGGRGADLAQQLPGPVFEDLRRLHVREATEEAALARDREHAHRSRPRSQPRRPRLEPGGSLRCARTRPPSRGRASRRRPGPRPGGRHPREERPRRPPTAAGARDRARGTAGSWSRPRERCPPRGPKARASGS